jgi:structural maintenance of chromosome 2
MGWDGIGFYGVQVLDNEIGPRMRQLNEERSVYLTFQKNQQELEKLEKVVVAHDFHLTKADVKQLAGELQETEDQLRDHKARVERLGVDVEDAEANLDALRRKREQEMGGGLRDLEKEVQEVLKQLVTQTTILGNKDELLQAEHDAKARLLADIHDTGVTIAAKEADLARGQDDYAGLARESDACAHELEQTQQAILTSQAGMAGGANLAKSFAEQLRGVCPDKTSSMAWHGVPSVGAQADQTSVDAYQRAAMPAAADAENDATAAATAAKQAEMRHKHAQGVLHCSI